MKNILITGASTGIGRETAKIFIEKGYNVGLCSRKIELLEDLKQQYNTPNIHIAQIDITDSNAADKIEKLIEAMGGMDTYIHVAGIGFQNKSLDPEIEIKTAETNSIGFIRSTTTAYNYFKKTGTKGHIAIVSSIAGTKGLGAAPAYSATKKMQSQYLQALVQKTAIDRLDISFTDIRPGFIATSLLDTAHHYPMVLNLQKASTAIAKSIEKKKRVSIIDWKYYILTKIWSLIPNCIWERLPVQN